MNYPWAVPGAKVVCVKRGARWPKYDMKFSQPHKGKEYTIREIFEFRGRIGLRFEEIQNADFNFAHGPAEPAWGIEFFRPLITQADDVAKFAWMLTETKEKVDA